MYVWLVSHDSNTEKLPTYLYLGQKAELILVPLCIMFWVIDTHFHPILALLYNKSSIASAVLRTFLDLDFEFI